MSSYIVHPSDDEDNDLSAYYLAASGPTELFLEPNSTSPNLSTLMLHKDSARDLDTPKFRAIMVPLEQLLSFVSCLSPDFQLAPFLIWH
jgi:hypothetical protein